MSEDTWKRLWVLALRANGYTSHAALHIFNVLYGNQPVDLNKDPIADALVMVPKATASIGGEDVRSDITSERLDGLLQQSRAA